MIGTKINKNPAEQLGALVVTQKTAGNLAKVAAKMNQDYFKANPNHTQDMWQAWANTIEANGYSRLVNGMSRIQKKVADVEVPRIMEEMGKVRGNYEDLAVHLPELFPGKRPMKGSKQAYVEPVGMAKPYPNQVKTRNVLQNHPEVYGDNTGDSFHVVESGVGLAPSGKLYADARPLPAEVQLKNVTDTRKIYAKLGGTTTLSLAGIDSINPSPDYVKNSLKKNKAQWNKVLNSTGHHIRGTADVMKTIVRITGKYDGAKSDLFAYNGKVWMGFRDGTRLDFTQNGDALNSCELTLEWVDPLPGDEPVTGSGIPQIEGKVPIVTTLNALNFPNIFGFDMLAAVGPPAGEFSEGRRRSRIEFEFASVKVPVLTPKVLWESGEVPLWCADLEELYAAGPDSCDGSTTLHKVDGAVFHGVGGDQDLGKFYKTVDLDRQTARKLGVNWSSEGTKIREYVASRDDSGSPVYTFWRMRDENNGGTKYKPNGMQNIIATALSPDVTEVISFLREVDFHDRSTHLMENLENEIDDGLTWESWKQVVEAVESEDTAGGIGDLLRSYLLETKRDGDLLQDGVFVDLFAKYFTSG